MSEAYLNRVFPAMRSAYPTEWVRTIDRALAMDVDRYVPGHGFIEEPKASREELVEYQKALQYVIAEVKRLHKLGLSADDAREAGQLGRVQGVDARRSAGLIAIRQDLRRDRREAEVTQSVRRPSRAPSGADLCRRRLSPWRPSCCIVGAWWADWNTHDAGVTSAGAGGVRARSASAVSTREAAGPHHPARDAGAVRAGAAGRAGRAARAAVAEAGRGAAVRLRCRAWRPARRGPCASR